MPWRNPRNRGRQRFTPSAEATAALREDYPEAVRLRLRLLQAGGRQRPQRCIACGKRGLFGELYVPAETLKPLPGPTPPIAYWTCAGCHGALSQDDVARLLQARGGGSQDEN